MPYERMLWRWAPLVLLLQQHPAWKQLAAFHHTCVLQHCKKQSAPAAAAACVAASRLVAGVEVELVEGAGGKYSR